MIQLQGNRKEPLNPGSAGTPAGKDITSFENRRGKSLVWLLLALSIILFATAFALESTACEFLFDPSQPAPAFAYGIALVPISALVFSLLGTLLILNRPDNRIGWLTLLFFGLGLNLLIVLFSYSSCAVQGENVFPLGQEFFWLGETIGSIVVTTAFVLLFMLFPNGRFLSPRWKRLAILLLVIMMTMAVLRALKYRLYDIDIIIRRTLQYGLLTAVLVAVYFGVVLLAQSAFVALTGQENPVAIVISTLVIAALFNPLRKRLQDFIDRRSYRQNYDAALTLQQFAQTARDEVVIEQLTADLRTIIQETMQPESLSLWLLAPSFSREPASRREQQSDV